MPPQLFVAIFREPDSVVWFEAEARDNRCT